MVLKSQFDFALTLQDVLAILSVLLLALIFLVGEGALRPLLKRKPKIGIENARFDARYQNETRWDAYFDIRNYGKASVTVLFVRMRIANEWSDFLNLETNPFQVPAYGFHVVRFAAIDDEKTLVFHADGKRFELPTGRDYRIEIRYSTKEGEVRKWNRRILLHADYASPSTRIE